MKPFTVSRRTQRALLYPLMFGLVILTIGINATSRDHDEDKKVFHWEYNRLMTSSYHLKSRLRQGVNCQEEYRKANEEWDKAKEIYSGLSREGCNPDFINFVEKWKPEYTKDARDKKIAEAAARDEEKRKQEAKQEALARSRKNEIDHIRSCCEYYNDQPLEDSSEKELAELRKKCDLIVKIRSYSEYTWGEGYNNQPLETYSEKELAELRKQCDIIVKIKAIDLKECEEYRNGDGPKGAHYLEYMYENEYKNYESGHDKLNRMLQKLLVFKDINTYSKANNLSLHPHNMKEVRRMSKRRLDLLKTSLEQQDKYKKAQRTWKTISNALCNWDDFQRSKKNELKNIQEGLQCRDIKNTPQLKTRRENIEKQIKKAVAKKKLLSAEEQTLYRKQQAEWDLWVESKNIVICYH